ncbi:MAG TPA: FxSxx-COOH system tetratricopeptide repeat protein [Ktedonobacteraceae bacterium]|nr:FxSxx-COOH system tetratricopeptide repeat protein [Ktedonobacteraceae bacterium]
MKREETQDTSPSSFQSLGQYILWHRLRLGMSQEALAEAIGASARSLRRWEQDLVFPQKMWRERLARQFGLALPDLVKVFAAEAASPLSHVSSLWTVPFPRNPYFTGRDAVLQTLHDSLHAGSPMSSTSAISLYGLAGIGKTQVAVEYAYRFARAYTAVFWLDAETPESLRTTFVQLAQTLDLPEAWQAEQQRIITAMRRWLNVHEGWLLLCDNVEDVEALSPFLPTTPQGTLLLTTRHRTLGTLALELELSPWSEQDSMLFLLRRAGLLDASASQATVEQLAQTTPDTYTQAKQLVEIMGGLPLALDQAGAYLVETSCSLQEYLHLYQSHSRDLLQRRGRALNSHPASVATTWMLSLQRVEQVNSMAADLLRLCAFVHPEAIPEELLTQDGAIADKEEATTVPNPLAFHEAISILSTYSLLKRDSQTRTLSLHRLVQTALRASLDTSTAQKWSERTLHALNTIFPEVDYETWSQCERLFPHASAYLRQLDSAPPPGPLALLLHKMADYLTQRGQYTDAEPLLQRALQLQESILGIEHPDLAASLNRLAELFRIQSRYGEAEALFQQALSLQEHALEPDLARMATSLTGLADLFFHRSQFAEAEPLFRRALSLQEQAWGPLHPEIALSYYNLAEAALQQERSAEAEPLYQQALHIQEQTSGLDHPRAATFLNGLAMLYFQQGRYTEAEPLLQQALALRERTLGAEHPSVATSLNNLAALYQLQKRSLEAGELLERALHIWEVTFGVDHPNVAFALVNQAEVYIEQQRTQEAEALYQRALSIWEQALGPSNALLSHPLNELAALYRQQERFEEAEALSQRIRLSIAGET